MACRLGKREKEYSAVLLVGGSRLESLDIRIYRLLLLGHRRNSKSRQDRVYLP